MHKSLSSTSTTCVAEAGVQADSIPDKELLLEPSAAFSGASSTAVLSQADSIKIVGGGGWEEP